MWTLFGDSSALRLARLRVTLSSRGGKAVARELRVAAQQQIEERQKETERNSLALTQAAARACFVDRQDWLLLIWRNLWLLETRTATSEDKTCEGKKTQRLLAISGGNRSTSGHKVSF